MSRGSIRRRGESSWELKFDVPSDGGKRQTKFVSFKGSKAEAQKELTRLLAQRDGGTLVDPSKLTVAEHMRKWVKAADIEPRTRQRYSELIEAQIIPHLGSIPLQRLRPVAIKEWHATLLQKGGKDGRPLSARTVGHAHRCLRTGLQSALRDELVSRNVAAVHSPPKVDDDEIEILEASKVPVLLAGITGHTLGPIGTLALATGCRRGELLALAWSCVDLDGATIRIERAVEQTKVPKGGKPESGLRFKPPKTKNGRRTISLPSTAVAALREHKVRQLELRMQLGLGRPEPDALVFCRFDGTIYPPNDLSRDWARAVKALALPKVSFHALRHSHASALIAAGMDVVAVSKRLGHGSPAMTLKCYAHLFRSKDDVAAVSIDAIMRG
jgi:integrase